MDIAGDAQIDFPALCIGLRVVPPKTSPGQPSYQPGFKAGNFQPSSGEACTVCCIGSQQQLIHLLIIAVEIIITFI
jgi:hypothetical protein